MEALEEERANLEEMIRARMKVLKLIPGRVEREGPLMYSPLAVQEAKKIKLVEESS